MKWRGWWRAFAAPEIPERHALLERVLKLDMKMMAVPSTRSSASTSRSARLEWESFRLPGFPRVPSPEHSSLGRAEYREAPQPPEAHWATRCAPFPSLTGYLEEPRARSAFKRDR